MKLIWCCFLAACVAVSLAAIDVEKTVKQVQSILQANQQLPRLSRDEIIQLLNDIRSEDSKSSIATSKEPEEDVALNKIPLQYSSIINEVNPPLPNVLENIVGDNKDISGSAPETANVIEVGTGEPLELTEPVSMPQESISIHELYPQEGKNEKSNDANNGDSVISLDAVDSTTTSKPTLMVVLPYTPRDGSSLQELYTRPPRVKVVHESSTTPKPKNSKPSEKYADNDKLATDLINMFPDELKAFLDSHGLKGKPGQDHFLLPLEGFKPMPPAKIIDGSVDLPENILLTYDLISPTSEAKAQNSAALSMSPSNFLYAPLRPELPFELDVSSSETKEISIPYAMPVKKLPGVANYDPIDYDSVKVIPLRKGINPVSEQVVSSNDQIKRQVATEATTTQAKEENTTTTTTTTTTEQPKTNADNESAADTDSGASISDLEASFGGAVPAQPGDSQLPPPKKNGFYWMLDWNSFLEVGDGDTKINIRFEPKLGDPQMFLPVTVP